jgi:hypothetical protein
MVEVKIGDWLREGWELVKDEWLTFSVAGLLVMLVGGGACGILLGPMMIGLYRMCFRRMRREPVQIGDVFQGFESFATGFGVWGLMFLATLPFIAIRMAAQFGGQMLIQQQAGSGSGSGSQYLPLLMIVQFAGIAIQAIGQVAVQTIWLFAFQRATDRPTISSMDAIRDSYEMVKRAPVMFVLCAVVFGIVQGLGVLACCVGSFFTYALVAMAGACAYRDCFGLAAAPQPAYYPPVAPPPPPGWTPPVPPPTEGPGVDTPVAPPPVLPPPGGAPLPPAPPAISPPGPLGYGPPAPPPVPLSVGPPAPPLIGPPIPPPVPPPALPLAPPGPPAASPFAPPTVVLPPSAPPAPETSAPPESRPPEPPAPPPPPPVPSAPPPPAYPPPPQAPEQ